MPKTFPAPAEEECLPTPHSEGLSEIVYANGRAYDFLDGTTMACRLRQGLDKPQITAAQAPLAGNTGVGNP